MAMNLSNEPKIARWIITGLSNPFFKGFTSAYPIYSNDYSFPFITLSNFSDNILLNAITIQERASFVFVHFELLDEIEFVSAII